MVPSRSIGGSVFRNRIGGEVYHQTVGKYPHPQCDELVETEG